MKIALVTTTINVPHVLALYAAQAKRLHDIQIFVAGDLKTPDGAKTFCEYHDIFYFTPDQQKEWPSSELIGWNNDSRRNFAILEALRWGAELLITVDDDMIPQMGFFTDFIHLFTKPWSGVQLGVPGFWIDHGQFTHPPAPARGLPVQSGYDHTPGFVKDVEIGIAQGSILGVPDTDAMTAIVKEPFIHSISDVLRAGFVAHPEALAVCNSQITAFRRELAPEAGQFYLYQKRNTDIIASVLMREHAKHNYWYTHYGLPMGFHARRKRPLLHDLSAELYGLQAMKLFNEYKTPLVFPEQVHDVWLDDCKKAMA